MLCTYVLDVRVRLVVIGLGSDKLRLDELRLGDSDGDGEFEDILRDFKLCYKLKENAKDKL